MERSRRGRLHRQSDLERSHRLEGKSKEEAMAGFVALSKKAKHNYSDNFFVYD